MTSLKEKIWIKYALGIQSWSGKDGKPDPNAMYFIASAVNKGPAAGSFVPDQNTNNDLFEQCDALIADTSPVYNPGNAGSYFDCVDKYISTVRLNENRDQGLQQQLDDAKAKLKKMEDEFDEFQNKAMGRWEKDRRAGEKAKGALRDLGWNRRNVKRFRQVYPNVDADTGMAKNAVQPMQLFCASRVVFVTDQFVRYVSNVEDDWMNQYATDYVEACRTRDALAGKLRHSSVKLAKEMLDDAQARLEPKQGNNMPCVVSDVGILNGRATQQADIVYRPRYYLSGDRSTAKRWRDEYYDKTAAPEQRLVSFEVLKNKTWAQLGIIEPTGANDIDNTPEIDFNVTLIYTGIGVFDVKRGLWDINDFRTLLPQLASTAPPDCHQPLYKTTKLLLAYGVNVILKLPQVMDQDVASRLRLMPGLMDDLPLTLVNGNELHAQPQTNDAYPVLLAVLADKC
ncbi:hypothetical protein FBEOM_10772 [Fusarium beomiforme]|uniref:Uncharacterized protein n=1 Tax=Fusarium beomiforme TaxID=44412 RepID=A0A9P5ABS2_9HYPO|nr:hypothetical protein FBEOM_10772 [Fusarium beomiforme]